MDNLTKQAVNHTLHCLLGCSIGEVLGMVIATALGWDNFQSITIAILLAFFFGYLLTFQSVYRKGESAKNSAKTALITDTASITSMEVVDNTIILLIPGALGAGLNNGLFWISLAVSLIIAFLVTVPINRWLISRSGHSHGHH